MSFVFRVLLFCTCLFLVTANAGRIWKRALAPSSTIQMAVIEDSECASGCLNQLRLSTEADEEFQKHFLELSSFGSVVPQVLISNLDLSTFQRYCLNVYTPVRECLIACSNNFTADLLRNTTMLETMCIDYYKEMNQFMPCMQFSYENTASVCETKCFSSDVDAKSNSTDDTSITNTTADDFSSTAELTEFTQLTDDAIYLRPNETLSLFCMLLDCVSTCQIPLLQGHCGHDAAVLEGVLIDAMARTEKITIQLDDTALWPPVCDNLILRDVKSRGQQQSRMSFSCWVLVLTLCNLLWMTS